MRRRNLSDDLRDALKSAEAETARQRNPREPSGLVVAETLAAEMSRIAHRRWRKDRHPTRLWIAFRPGDGRSWILLDETEALPEGFQYLTQRPLPHNLDRDGLKFWIFERLRTAPILGGRKANPDNMADDWTVANTIRAQIGIPLLMRFGASNLLALENGFRFSMRVSRTRVVTVRITLNAMDTYDVDWVLHPRRKPWDIKARGNLEDVYVDQLREVLDGIFRDHAVA